MGERGVQAQISPRVWHVAKTTAHFKVGVDFAQSDFISLVIRNTGHDFMGHTTGYGSRAINVYSFKSAAFTLNYAGPGGAVTVGAGIETRDFTRWHINRTRRW